MSSEKPEAEKKKAPKHAAKRTAEEEIPHTMASRAGWYIRICKSKTDADNIYFRVGRGGDGDSHKDWFAWNRNDKPGVDEYDFPPELIDAGECWIEAKTDGKDARVCLCFRDHVVQDMDFDDEPDRHEKHTNDTDTCDC